MRAGEVSLEIQSGLKIHGKSAWRSLFRTLLNQKHFNNSLGSGVNPSGGWEGSTRFPGGGDGDQDTGGALPVGEGVPQSFPREDGTTHKKGSHLQSKKENKTSFPVSACG